MMEYHGPYQHARGTSGFVAINDGNAGDPDSKQPHANIPLELSPVPTGVALNSSFISEFGSVCMSSFESMSATLLPAHWGLHGGSPPDECHGGLPNAGAVCKGSNPMAQRNYACDTLIVAYFGMLCACVRAYVHCYCS